MNAEVILELEEAVAGQEHTARVSEIESVQTEEIVPALSLWNSEQDQLFGLEVSRKEALYSGNNGKEEDSTQLVSVVGLSGAGYTSDILTGSGGTQD